MVLIYSSFSLTPAFSLNQWRISKAGPGRYFIKNADFNSYAAVGSGDGIVGEPDVKAVWVLKETRFKGTYT